MSAESEYQQRFDAAMQDDFNTADALAVLFDVARDLNRAKTEQSSDARLLAGILRKLAGILGLLEADAAEYLKSSVTNDGLSDAAIEQMIASRQQAKSDKNWTLADQIRNELTQAGIIIEDSADGTRWRR